MVRVVSQDVPAWFYRQYERTLGFAQEWHVGSGIHTIRKRPPYRLPKMKSEGGNSPSGAQLKVRAAFKKCVDCFNASPREGGVEPPAIGYRSKAWWYAAAVENTWPPYLGEDFLKWTDNAEEPFPLKDSDGVNHDANWFLKTDEQDFIDFYEEMKPKYGYPWSTKNNPDQIVTKMNQIVCDEIEYDLKADATKAYTPGQTALSRKGICDDQSILHFALTWKALKELEWSDAAINYRLSCVFNDQEGSGHVYNWWKANNGTTRIIENTYDPGTSPKILGEMEYWKTTVAWAVFQRFNKAGHWYPKVHANGDIVPLWYYNWFIAASWQYFFDGETPDWCATVIPCDSVQSALRKFTGLKIGWTWDACWTSTYNTFLSLSWVEDPVPVQLKSLGHGTHSGYEQWKGVINISKNTIVFKPEEHMTQSKWDEIESLKLVIKRGFYGSEADIEGGAIKCIETGVIKEQIYGDHEFIIPKDICNFEEFTLTIEGLCRNIDDLRPEEPITYYDTKYCGSVSNIYEVGIYNAKLIC